MACATTELVNSTGTPANVSPSISLIRPTSQGMIGLLDAPNRPRPGMETPICARGMRRRRVQSRSNVIASPNARPTVATVGVFGSGTCPV
ncbi:hypothetical protein ACVWWK_005236 [Bradyrhizobium sp. LB9.1b]